MIFFLSENQVERHAKIVPVIPIVTFNNDYLVNPQRTMQFSLAQLFVKLPFFELKKQKNDKGGECFHESLLVVVVVFIS